MAVGRVHKGITFQDSPPQQQKPTEGPHQNLPLKGTPHPGASKKQAPPPEATSTPEETSFTKNAGVTPFHSAPPPELQEKHEVRVAANTPFQPKHEQDSSPLATARRDLLRNMRDFAGSPREKLKQPPSAILSPEANENPVVTGKSVGFSSPVQVSPAGKMLRSKRRVATPHPKRSPSNLTLLEQRALLEEAVGCATFLYECPGQLADFIVRRPFGLATEQDLWFRAGQLSAKLYVKHATVDNASTLEVAAIINADGSLLTIHGESQARHQTDAGKSTEFDNVEEQTLGTVNYIDKDANEKEYSLDELYDLAISVREHYASSVLAGSESLRLRGASIQAPPQRAASTSPEPESKAVAFEKPETCDKAVLTDTMEEPSAVKKSHEKQVASMPEDSSSDILGSAIALFFSAIFSVIWFFLVGLPLRIISTTVVLAASAVVLSCLWLFIVDLSVADEMGATMRMFTNQAGIL